MPNHSLIFTSLILPPLIHPKPTSFKFPAFLPESSLLCKVLKVPGKFLTELREIKAGMAVEIDYCSVRRIVPAALNPKMGRQQRNAQKAGGTQTSYILIVGLGIVAPVYDTARSYCKEGWNEPKVQSRDKEFNKPVPHYMCWLLRTTLLHSKPSVGRRLQALKVKCWAM